MSGCFRPWLPCIILILVVLTPVPAQAMSLGMKGPPELNNAELKEEQTHPDIARRVFLYPLRLFQRHISPIDGPRCQFSPTCSAYGHEAVATEGPLFGILLTADRLMRCTPWNQEGSYQRLPNGRLSDPLAENLLEE